MVGELEVVVAPGQPDQDAVVAGVALEAPEHLVLNQAFNVGQTAHNYRICDIAKIVAEVVPCCRIEYAAGASPDRRS